jgi:hypothetical protein
VSTLRTFVTRDDCVASDVNMTLSGAPAFDKNGDLIYRSLADQLEADREHDLLTLNRQRCVTLTDASFEEFSKLVKAKKPRKRAKKTTLRQDAAAYALLRQKDRKEFKALVQMVGNQAMKDRKEVKKEQKATENEAKKEKKMRLKLQEKSETKRGVKQPRKTPVKTSQSSSSSSSSSVPKKNPKRKREEEESE